MFINLNIFDCFCHAVVCKGHTSLTIPQQNRPLQKPMYRGVHIKVHPKDNVLTWGIIPATVWKKWKNPGHTSVRIMGFHTKIWTLSHDHFCNLACSPLATCHPLLTSSTKTPHTFPPNSSNSPSFVASSFAGPYVNACTSCNRTRRLLNYTVLWKVQITQILCHFPEESELKI